MKAQFVKNAGIATGVACALLAFGFNNESHDSISLMATFALAGLAGYQVVWGVAPALHSPLMAVTNAISGMTAVGGMLLLAQGTSESSSLIPDSPAHWMGAIATVLSFINIVGGFLITGKMLDLFRRPEDPNDYFEFYAIPAAVLVGGLAGSYVTDSGNFESVSGSVGIAAAICAISASKFVLPYSCYCDRYSYNVEFSYISLSIFLSRIDNSCRPCGPEECTNRKHFRRGRCHIWTCSHNC